MLDINARLVIVTHRFHTRNTECLKAIVGQFYRLPELGQRFRACASCQQDVLVRHVLRNHQPRTRATKQLFFFLHKKRTDMFHQLKKLIFKSRKCTRTTRDRHVVLCTAFEFKM